MFVAAGAARGALDAPPGAWARMRQAGALREVSQLHEASVFVVLNPAKPGDRIKVTAGMLGRAVCTPLRLSSGAGPFLQLRPGLQRPRYIFVTAFCQAKHIDMIAFMQATSKREPRGRWRWHGPAQVDARTFLDRADKRAGAHASEMVTLMNAEEVGEAAFARFPRKMTLRSFVDQHVWQVDWSRSHMGVCKR